MHIVSDTNQKGLQENQTIANRMNVLMIALTLIMMVIYYAIGAHILVTFSIFIALGYAFNFLLIRNRRMVESTWSTYALLTLYMVVCTICLGYDYGFQLYTMSTIPLIFQLKYISKKFNQRDPKAAGFSIIILLSSLISSLYTVKVGPIYHIGGLPPLIFLGMNICIVCYFLIFFSSNTINQIIDFEIMLGRQANFDALTGLANRYRMQDYLKEIFESQEQSDGQASKSTDSSENIWVAMLDIDFFKKINDKYGHATGDRVLEKLAETLRKVCQDCEVSRWGGEEFLICGKGDPQTLLENLVKKVESVSVQSPHGNIHFTISVGVTHKTPNDTLDTWVTRADKLLYKAKENGKNQVVV